MTLQTMANDAFELVNNSVQRRKGAATAASVEPTQQEINELYNERITPETDLPPMQPLMQMFGVPCFYRGEVVADGGKAKSGKTFFLSILMATCLSQKVLELERYGWTEDSQPSDFSPLKVRCDKRSGILSLCGPGRGVGNHSQGDSSRNRQDVDSARRRLAAFNYLIINLIN